MATSKTKKTSEDSRMQKIADSIQNTADKLREQVTNRVQGSSAKAKVRSVDLAISMVKLQQSAFDRAFKEVAKLQKRSDKLVKAHIQDADWMPSEGSDIVKEWSRMLNDGRDDFQKTLDKSYDLLKNGLERARKQQLAEGKKKAAPAKKKTAAKKKAVAKKKPAATKKAATKKAATKKKTTAKKKTASK